jgi:hypothetical protein
MLEIGVSAAAVQPPQAAPFISASIRVSKHPVPVHRTCLSIHMPE